MTRPRYTRDQKQAAIAVAKQVGPSEASRRTGIPIAAIRSMLYRDDKTNEARAMMVPVADARLPVAADFDLSPWDDLREKLPDELGRLGRMALAAATAAVQVGNGNDADKMASVAIKCITQAESLRGRGTGQNVPVSVVLTASLEALQRFQVVDASAVDSTIAGPLLDDPALIEQAVDGEDDL